MMSTRFTSNIALAVAGAVIVVSSQAFSTSFTGWLTFGIALGVLVALGIAQLDAARGLAQRGLDATAAALAAWSAVASVVFTGSTLMWLSLGEGLGFVALAVVGLAAHEFATERVVHELYVAHAEPMRERSDELQSAA